jgi:dTDP-4-dehydrorhamnose 3,5-epimerase
VVKGSVFDVAVDVRRSSPTFGRSVGVILSDTNHHMLWVPPGFAHGFLVLSDRADFVYRCTAFYAPEHERSILWSDRDLAIAWPLAPDETPLLSPRDATAPNFKDAEHYP